jgi:hypothetical protein
LNLVGDEAERAAAFVLPAVNWAGAEQHEVRDAVGLIESSNRSPADFLRDTARRFGVSDRLEKLPSAHRLALEMAAHEETERRAMEGELALLEAAWRQAEEVAEIADNLLVPPSVDEFIERNRANRQAR